MFTTPTIAEFKSKFSRDFPYGSDTTTVMDADITSALGDAAFGINSELFGTQENYTLGYLLLTAHNLVLNLRASSQGIAGQYSFLQGSKGVGSISESFAIPQRILENPILAMYCKTHYGAKYISFVLPMLSGQMFTVESVGNA